MPRGWILPQATVHTWLYRLWSWITCIDTNLEALSGKEVSQATLHKWFLVKFYFNIWAWDCCYGYKHEEGGGGKQIQINRFLLKSSLGPICNLLAPFIIYQNISHICYCPFLRENTFVCLWLELRMAVTALSYCLSVCPWTTVHQCPTTRLKLTTLKVSLQNVLTP